MRRLTIFTLLALAAFFFVASPATAYDRVAGKPAIVLAAFGTTELSALNSFQNIIAQVEKAFPDYEVHIAFTSNIIRKIWHDRYDDGDFDKKNPGVDTRFYEIGNVLTELAKIQERGADIILVQSLHITDGEEYEDVKNLVSTVQKIKTYQPSLTPFPWIGLGVPALGEGDGPAKEIAAATKALESIVNEAKSKNAALVLMGHGNEKLTQKVYGKLQKSLRDAYGPQIYVGTVEAPPHAPEILAELNKSTSAVNPKKILLTPLMIVAGDHAHNDMAGDEPDSWASVFKAGGYEVESRLIGLGLNNDWVNIYINHLKALEAKVKAQKK
ncbi:MAG: sirohydrochlorin cobaltochelatase [Deltaproteobacteria bacterium]|jgi:sirohydrochlorin cobaltochelatase|nr:sirohydrochlorin cobaltochelatase [Deltaproteobacteria bacterium]